MEGYKEKKRSVRTCLDRIILHIDKDTQDLCHNFRLSYNHMHLYVIQMHTH